MIQKLLFAETLGIDKFDVTKTKLSLGNLVEEFKKSEALAFETDKK
jgi:hypothetical protein